MKERKYLLEGNQIILVRQRIHQLLRKSLSQPLVTVIAGPGYGKTTAVASFVQNLKRSVIWLQLTELDNDTERLWKNICLSVERELPEISEKLRKISPFTKTEELDQYFDVFSSITDEPLWVVDNIDCITNPEIHDFIVKTTKINIEKRIFCVMILSKRKVFVQTGSYTYIDNNAQPFLITNDDLSFTPKEIIELFKLHDIDINSDSSLEIFKETQGWIFLLQIMLNKTKNQTILTSQDFIIAAQTFNNQYFINYNEVMQKTLIKLSMLPFFTVDIIKSITGELFLECVQDLDENIFVDYSYTTRFYVFHSVYKKFLNNLEGFLDKNEISIAMQISAQHYMEYEYHYEAAKIYYKIRDYNAFLLAILSGASYTTTEINTLLEMIYKIIPIYKKNSFTRFMYGLYVF
ncbi:MAG: AAA family ATPase [Coprobacillaceae bacterium]